MMMMMTRMTTDALDLLPAGTTPSPPVDPPFEEIASVQEPGQEIVVEQLAEYDLSVADLETDITDVLADGGYTQFMGASELSETLSDDVVQVLIDEEAVLVIPSSDGG
jgi:hypothetical protein